MKLNNGTKWGAILGGVIGGTIVVAVGMDDSQPIGVFCFCCVLGGAIVGTVLGMLRRPSK